MKNLADGTDVETPPAHLAQKNVSKTLKDFKLDPLLSWKDSEKKKFQVIEWKRSPRLDWHIGADLRILKWVR